MRTRRLLMTFGLSLMIVGGVMTSAAAFSSIEKEPAQARTFVASPTPALTPTAVVPELPSPTATAEPSRSQIERLVIPSAGIDASVVTLGVKPDGEMQTPNTPNDVGWYDFTAYPGFGSNAVFSGHVDYANYGAAVFWHLRSLSEGDEVGVRLTDGTYYAYRVISAQTFSSDDAPVQEIIGPTEAEIITLITCSGSFNTRTRQYDERLIVRAERVIGPEDGTTALSR